MKKFTLFAIAALMAVTAMAQPKGKLQTQARKVSKAETQVKKPEREVRQLTGLTMTEANKMRQLPRANKQAQRLTTAKDKQQKPQPTARRRAANLDQRRAAGVIIDQPAGTYQIMKYASNYFGYSLFGPYSGTYDEALGELVEGTDGCLYLHNLLTEMATEEGYWVKAEKVEGKADTYVIHKQPIYVEEYYGALYTYYIQKCMLSLDGSQIIPALNTDITVTWKDGVLRTAAEFNNADIRTVISAIDNSDYWSGAMNWNVTMTPQTAQAITSLPDGVTAVKMIGKYAVSVDDEGNVEYGATKMQMAVDGSDMYLQFSDDADAWVKGTIAGDKVTFPSGQYLGPNFQYQQHNYFLAVTADGDGNITIQENAVFDYDASAQTLKNSNVSILINGGSSNVFYLSRYDNPEIFKFQDIAATPQAPADMSSAQYSPNYGYGYLDFSIPVFDAEGNYLDPDQLYYKVYVGDDENNTVFTFSPDEYSSLGEAITEVPATLSSGDFWNNGAGSYEFALYCNMSKNFGVQAIYKGGGEEHASEITWNWDNNGASGFESVTPNAEEPDVYSELAEGEMAVNLGEAAYGYGTGRMATERFDVAMKVDDNWTSGATISGKKVVGVSVPFTSVKGISDCKVWLSTSIELNADGTFTPDGPVKEFVPAEEGFTTVKFDEPFEIPAYDESTDKGGLFIGYSFTQTPDAESGEAATPVMLTGYTNVGGFFIHTDKVFRLGWASMEGVEGDLALEAIITGAPANAAEITTMGNSFQKTGEAGAMNVTISNYGYKGLTSATLDTKILGDGVEINGEYTCSVSLKPVFGAYTTFSMPVSAVPTSGDDVMYANVTKANDADNGITAAEALGNVFVKDFLPVKRPLLEEYTGTWCGYCPRGYVALEKMAELYPEDFVALSYHNGDPMEFTTKFPSLVEGFPAAYLDRAMDIDAYKGATSEDFGIEQTWNDRRKEFGVADINVEASLSADNKTVNVKSTATFADNAEDANYTIAYALVADGLTGTGSEWAQSNYYADQAIGTPLYMEKFYNGASYVEGLVFNDVIVATSDYAGVEGSVPATIVASTPYTHEFSFNLDEVVNTAGAPIIQDTNKLKVVAMLLEWGADVKNANKCKVVSITDGISNINSNAQVVKTEYFDLSGRRVLIPSTGIYIKNVQYKDGRTATQKVVVK